MERFILAVEGAEAVGATPAQELGHRYSFHILAAKGAGVLLRRLVVYPWSVAWPYLVMVSAANIVSVTI